MLLTEDAACTLSDTIYWRLRNRRWEIEKFECYYNGQQELNYATDEWLLANGQRYSDFADNWCASVVNAIGERTKVIGIKLRGDDPLGSPDIGAISRASGLWDQWNINDMDAQSSQGFLTSFIAKRSYVLVWPGADGDADITWEHPSNVEIQYDWMNPRLRTAALKSWVDDTTEYATLYTPDFLYKWQRARVVQSFLFQPQSIQAEERGIGAFGKWQVRVVPGETWPLKNPMGVVPIVEVANRPLLRGEPVSEIAGVIPMQDAINLLWAYLFFAADYASMPARVLLGTTPPMQQVIDAVTGLVVGEVPLTMERLQQARLAVFEGPNAKIAQWDASNLQVFTDVIEIGVGHIAAQTRTPATYLMANKGLSNVSAEGMESSESGLAQKELEFQTFAGPDVKEVFRMIALAQDDTALAKEVRLATIQWQNAFIRSPTQQSAASLAKRQTGYPFGWIMEEDGVSPYDQTRIMDMVAMETEQAKSVLVAGADDTPLTNDVPNVVPVV